MRSRLEEAHRYLDEPAISPAAACIPKSTRPSTLCIMAGHARSLPTQPISRAPCITKPARGLCQAAPVRRITGVYFYCRIRLVVKIEESMADVKGVSLRHRRLSFCRLMRSIIPAPSMAMSRRLIILYDYAALRARLDRDAISASSAVQNCWRYKAAACRWRPRAKCRPWLSAGRPCTQTPRIARMRSDCVSVWVKDDGANPTGSLKGSRQRAGSLARALELGIQYGEHRQYGQRGCCTGRFGRLSCLRWTSSSSCRRARRQQRLPSCWSTAPTVLLVEGSYDDAFDLVYGNLRRPGLVFAQYRRQSLYHRGQEDGRFGNRRAVELDGCRMWSRSASAMAAS